MQLPQSFMKELHPVRDGCAGLADQQPRAVVVAEVAVGVSGVELVGAGFQTRQRQAGVGGAAQHHVVDAE